MKKFWNWLTRSSANVEETSMTVKGIFTALIPIAIYFFHIFNIQVGSEQLSSIVDSIVAIVGVVLGIVSSIQVIVGFVRKIYLTIKGKNDVILASSREY